MFSIEALQHNDKTIDIALAIPSQHSTFFCYETNTWHYVESIVTPKIYVDIEGDTNTFDNEFDAEKWINTYCAAMAQNTELTTFKVTIKSEKLNCVYMY